MKIKIINYFTQARERMVGSAFQSSEAFIEAKSYPRIFESNARCGKRICRENEAGHQCQQRSSEFSRGTLQMGTRM